MNGSTRRRIYRENKIIAAENTYTADGKTIRPDRSRTENIYYPKDAELPVRTLPVPRNFDIPSATRRLDTISCVLTLRAEGMTGEIIALNFANAMVAGGGYRVGGDAQEESLCRCSLLYDELIHQKDFYRNHRRRPTPLYSHAMLLSRHVPVIRDMNGTLIDEQFTCSFLTCAAPNRRAAKFLFIPDKVIRRIMQERIQRIIALIAEIKPEAAVLGAFGCGAFGNKRKDVLPMIEGAVRQQLPPEIRVIFAAP